MPPSKNKTLRCPICRAEVPLASPDAPFCSDRCRVIDLGRWASGEYRISSPVLDPEAMEEVEAAELRRHRPPEPGDE
jgi:endogenous inhibitor of DNA gyrase (YacG/DUF329 family)